MEKFGLIGKSLKHSYSKPIHNLLGDYSYELFEIPPESVKDFVSNCELKGFNITIPYKKDVIPYLDFVDERALKIGAVNTVVNKNGKKMGFNTDFDGMVYLLKRAGIEIKDKCVLILGSGGTSVTARAVCESLGAKSIKVLSRSGEINYENYALVAKDTNVVINTTPVGMYPENYACKIDLSLFPNLSGVADAVYNPATTKLLYQAKILGVPYSNGLAMLVAQAKYAMEHFLDKKVSDSVIEPIIKTLSKKMQNIVLIGMPGSGKSTLAKKLALLLDREFIDTDELIVKKENMQIPQIFESKGEDYFRKIESVVLKEVGVLTGKIIATGGGVVKNKENHFPLKQNSTIIYIERDLDKLSSKGRPLSSSKQAIEKLYKERKDLYEFFADFKVDNNASLENTIKKITEKL